MVWKIAFTHFHHGGINLHHGNGFNLFMFDHFPQHAAVTAAYDKHPLDVAVGQNSTWVNIS